MSCKRFHSITFEEKTYLTFDRKVHLSAPINHYTLEISHYQIYQSALSLLSSSI